MQEHLAGHASFHDKLRDQYLYNGVLVRTSTKEARLTITNGMGSDKGETLVTTERETILFLWNWIQAMRRQQYRQSPAHAVPKPKTAEAEALEPCPFCKGDGFIPVWDTLAECAVCHGTGQALC